MINMKNKVAIITGAAQGIGKAIALRLGSSGANVVVSDLNSQKGEAVAGEIRNDGGKAIFIQTDVSDENSTRELAKGAVNEFGRIDILVNCAAIISTIKMKPFLEIAKDEWDRVMAINLGGVFLCCKAVVPQMQKQQQGRIINISSATVFAGRPNYLHYVTSKAGIIGLTRALAKEAGEYGITVNAVAPGSTITEVARETVAPERAKQMINNRCIKREQVPEDIIGAVLFLASDENGFMTGQTLVIDGGLIFH